MTCSRCTGLTMLVEACDGLAGERVWMAHCLCCGNLEDAVSQANRAAPARQKEVGPRKNKGRDRDRGVTFLPLAVNVVHEYT